MILVYQGEGADSFCVNSLAAALRLEGFDQVKLVDQDVFLDDSWKKNTRLLIFPGGRDVPYHNILKGDPNRQIKEFVQDGGVYLGICAGGYYGASFVEFEKGHPLEVVGGRELGFFSGVAKGPAYGPGFFSYRSQKGARIARLNLCGFAQLSSYYNGGCIFVHAESNPTASVIARYADIQGQPAAIIKCKAGKGIAILSGVHPEYSAKYEWTKKTIKGDLLALLDGIEEQRRILFRHILKEALP